MRLFEMKKSNLTKRTLAEKFIVPPFSVFNTHQTYWKSRYKYWLDIGVGGTNGRVTSNNGLAYDNRRMDKWQEQNKDYKREFNGTSSFSPVLCEVMYKWFTIPGSRVYDPFAGGLVRGVMAAIMGFNYTGIDINPKQVESNYEAFSAFLDRYDVSGTCNWIEGNSVEYVPEEKADFILTCPPYYNLETYTDIDGDLSLTETYEDFISYYTTIIKSCYNILNDDCFMVWVVSDVRDKKTTAYYGLVADTIKIGQEAGFHFYNEIILYNDTGNLAIVSGDYLNRARKVGRQHQNVLVFYKGDMGQIKEKFGEVM